GGARRWIAIGGLSLQPSEFARIVLALVLAAYFGEGRRSARGLGDLIVAGLFVAADRKSTRLNSSHEWISYAVFCLKKKKYIAEAKRGSEVGLNAAAFVSKAVVSRRHQTQNEICHHAWKKHLSTDAPNPHNTLTSCR